MPEDINIDLYSKSYIPENYLPAHFLRLSFYKNLSMSSSLDDIKEIIFHLLDRFGPIPEPLMNLIDEYKLRLKAADAGVESIVNNRCGTLISILPRKDFISESNIIKCVESYLNKSGDYSFHFKPYKGFGLRVCIHSERDADICLIVSRFLDKLNVMD